MVIQCDFLFSDFLFQKLVILPFISYEKRNALKIETWNFLRFPVQYDIRIQMKPEQGSWATVKLMLWDL